MAVLCGRRCAGWSVFTSWTICGDGFPISQVAGSDGYLLWVKNTLFILELAALQACQGSSHTIVTLGLYLRNSVVSDSFLLTLNITKSEDDYQNLILHSCNTITHHHEIIKTSSDFNYH